MSESQNPYEAPETPESGGPLFSNLRGLFVALGALTLATFAASIVATLVGGCAYAVTLMLVEVLPAGWGVATTGSIVTGFVTIVAFAWAWHRGLESLLGQDPIEDDSPKSPTDPGPGEKMF